jgi:hypothetical protein
MLGDEDARGIMYHTSDPTDPKRPLLDHNSSDEIEESANLEAPDIN